MLKSLIEQTYKNIEIIIINDGSKDCSESIIREYCKIDSRIIYEFKENGGQGSARNLGILKSKGEYIMFVDGDDWIERNMIEKMLDASNSETELIVSNYFIDTQNQTIEGITIPLYTSSKKKNLILSNCGPCFKIYKSSIFKENSIFFPEGIIYEDLAIIPYVNSLINNYVYLEEPFYHYCIRENSTMQKTVFLERERDIFKALENLAFKFDIEYEKELEFLFIRELLYFSYIRNIYFKTKAAKQFRKDIVIYIKNRFKNWERNPYHLKQKKELKFRSWLVINKMDFLIVFLHKIKQGVLR